MFGNAFEGVQKTLDSRQEMQQANWNKGKEDNTNAFLARLAQFQTPEEAQAALASGQLGQELQGYGSQIDGKAALAAKQGLVEGLQRRALASQQYTQGVQAHTDWTENLAQRDAITGLKGNILQSGNTDAITNLQAAIQARVDSGEISSRNAVELFQSVLGRENEIVNAQRAAEEEKRRVAEEAHKANTRPLDIELTQSNIAKLKAEAARARAEANGGGGGGARAAAIGPLSKLIQDIGATEMASAEGTLANSIFKGDLAVDAKGQTGIQKLLEDTGISAWNLGTNKSNFIENVIKKASQGGQGKGAVVSPDGKSMYLRSTDGRAVEVPLTQALFERALLNANGTVSDPSVGEVVDNLRALASSGDLVDAAVQYGGAQNKVRTTREGVSNALVNLLQGTTAPPEKKSR
jgi:hypothetical protein